MRGTVLAVVMLSLTIGLGVSLRADAGQADSLGLLGWTEDLDPPTTAVLSESIELRALARAATVRVAGRNCTGVLIGSGFHLDAGLISAQHLLVDAFDAKVDQPGVPVFSPVQRRSEALDVALLAPVGGIRLRLSDRDPEVGLPVLVAGHGGGGAVQLMDMSVLLVADGTAYGFDGQALLLDGVVPEGFSGGPVLDHRGDVLGMVQGYEPSLNLTVVVAAQSIETWLDNGVDGALPSGDCPEEEQG